MHIFGRAKSAILPLLSLLIVMFASAVDSKADVVGICATDTPGFCAASVNITGNVVTITLTNTSPVANGGTISALAFNLTAGTTINNFTTTNVNYALFGPAPTGWTGNVAPDSPRSHLISAAGNDYNGGGSAPGGAAPGDTVIFTLTLASLNGNTELSIFNSALVRQKAFLDGTSDKDAVLIQHMPEPASMLLLGTGLVGAAAAYRKRYKKEKG